MDNDTQISLVLFEDAIAHVCRVTRALKFQKGHIMLVGLSGSGRKSMIALGSVVNRSELLTVSPHKSYKKAEFREDIYKIMQRAAFEDKQVCLLFP